MSNGEFDPTPLPPRVAEACRRAAERIDENARRAGMSRRRFLRTGCAAASVLLALNELVGGRGGSYALAQGAEQDEAAADSTLAGGEFIFDVQGHHVSPDRDWHRYNRTFDFLQRTARSWCEESTWLKCYSGDNFIKEMFLDSDTRMAVLSALAGDERSNPLHIEEAAETRDKLAKMEGSPRLLLHGIVLPNLGPPGRSLDAMQAMAETWKVSAWKLYTLWGPTGKGWRLDDPRFGIPTIERGAAAGVPLFAIHKGIPLAGQDPEFTKCKDVGVVARRFPNVNFLIYHSGYWHDKVEGPYNPQDAERGVDDLIKSLQVNGIPPNANVYAELGSTWRALMSKPDEAAHVLGKLLKHVGEDRVLWGTDCIWYGSPQDQIQAFRAFQISPEFQERYGYPALTPQLKKKILGLNGARVYGVTVEDARRSIDADPVARLKQGYAQDPQPSFLTYGPTTRREVLLLRRAHHGLPG